MLNTLRHTRFATLIAIVGLASLALPSQAAIVSFSSGLSGPAEAPPNASPGTGTTLVTFDTTAQTMRVQVTFSGLMGNVTVAHIHATTAVAFAGTAGVATPTPTFPGFPAGNTFGTYDQTFDMTLASSYNPAFITNNGGTPASASAVLFSALEAGKAYMNVHSTLFPGGEIRGFPVPAPSAAALIGMGGLVATRRRRR